MARLLVVGPGYVGAKLAATLRSSGHEVFALGRRERRTPGVVSLIGDLTEPSSLELPAEMEAAFFTAAPDASTEDAYRALYLGGIRALRAALGPDERILFTSSTAVYGDDDGSLVDEQTKTQPTSFRGEVLLEAESYADVVLRLAGIYGPGRARALDRLRSGEARYAPGRYLNLIHRDDAAGILEHLMSVSEADRVYIGVDDEPVASEELYRFLAEELDAPAPEVNAAGPSSGAGKRLSNRKLRATGYSFRYPTFREGYGAILRASRHALEPCPASPNCVSTEATDERHRIPGLGFEGDLESVTETVAQTLVEIGGRVTSREPGRVQAEFTTSVVRFVDDVVVVADEEAMRIRFRSASRVGYSDLGANRRRMERLTEGLRRRDGFFVGGG